MHYVTTNLRLPEEVLKELKLRAIEEKKNVSQLVREAIQNFLLSPKKSIDYKNDPFNKVIGMAQSGISDGSIKHDHYLYGKSE